MKNYAASKDIYAQKQESNLCISVNKLCCLDYVQLEDDLGYIKSSHTDLSSSDIIQATKFTSFVQGVSVKVPFSPSMSQGLNLIKYW